MHPFKLRDAFLKGIGLNHSIKLEGVTVKVSIVRGLPYKQEEQEFVVEDSFYMPPEANEKPVVKDTNMLYVTFLHRDFQGIEIYLKEGKSFHVEHTQLLGNNPSFVYQKIRVTINGVDFGWFDYREVIRPAQH